MSVFVLCVSHFSTRFFGLDRTVGFFRKLGGALGIVPNGGIFCQPVDFLEAPSLAVKVKDTSAIRPCGRSNRKECWKWR